MRDLGRALVVQGDAAHLPLPDNSVDLICTSPPYFALRSYQDGGEHYAGQIGSEPTPQEFLDALWACTREWVRVLKPSGSIFVNLGDKYQGSGGQGGHTGVVGGRGQRTGTYANKSAGDYPVKSLMGLPWRYAIGCIDQLGLILRAELIWSKPNGLPESVTDRVRRSHEQWFHLTKEPRYYSAVDDIREEHREPQRSTGGHETGSGKRARQNDATNGMFSGDRVREYNPLGKLPGSVWTIPTEPLTVPAELGVDHFAAYPTEWPRRIIQGWSPRHVCTACGEGRRPDTTSEYHKLWNHAPNKTARNPDNNLESFSAKGRGYNIRQVTGWVCACTPRVPVESREYDYEIDEWITTTTFVYQTDGWTPPPSRPGVVVDPFGGTGTTALVARALGRDTITIDLSHDYSRLAQWRTTNPAQLAKVLGVDKPPTQTTGQDVLFP